MQCVPPQTVHLQSFSVLECMHSLHNCAMMLTALSQFAYASTYCTYVLSLCVSTYVRTCVRMYLHSMPCCMCHVFCRVRKNLAQCPLVPMEFIKMTAPPLAGKGKAKVRQSEGSVHLNLLYVYTYIHTYVHTYVRTYIRTYVRS